MSSSNRPPWLHSVVAPDAPLAHDPIPLDGLRAAFGLDGRRSTPLAALPFLEGDATLGSETELQTAVIGPADRVDLPIQVRDSNFFANVRARVERHEAPRRAACGIEAFLDNPEGVWENSWVRIPLRDLNPAAQACLEADLRADRADPTSPPRADRGRFFTTDGDGSPLVRVPVSYLLRLALVQWAGALGDATPAARRTAAAGRALLDHFTNDNCSPETFSFYVAPFCREQGHGAALARESSLRFLLGHLLLEYANRTMGLEASGQRAVAYVSPLPPQRQRRLNDFISDGFYRELFTNPCLAGWDRGEEKHRYMQLCHEVLSRSQLNAIPRLQNAGIITNNLVVLPNTSNCSLSNNGVHVSLGSARLGRMLADPASGFGPAHEKHLGDLAIKISEHFLPLFVGLYSAAPYRLAFSDFHPERLLGFLPHELADNHLRMLWHRWNRKAENRFLGKAFTPNGPRLLDRMIAGALGLRGDLVPDQRLLDYLVAFAGTARSPGLDGRLGNHERLKQDLADLGVFDPRMSVYQLLRLREHARMGFSGFEARFYSLFEDADAMARAVDLQVLITALAYRYALSGEVQHRDIPDDPQVESERRQIIFAAAIGVPVVYIHRETTNWFIRQVLHLTDRVRPSARYKGYWKVKVAAFQKGLLRLLRRDAEELAEAMGLGELLRDLAERLEAPAEHSASARLVREVMGELGERDPLRVPAGRFNAATERFYRTTLKARQVREGMGFLAAELGRIGSTDIDADTREALVAQGGSDPAGFVAGLAERVAGEELEASGLERLIGLVGIAAQRRAGETQRQSAAA